MRLSRTEIGVLAGLSAGSGAAVALGTVAVVVGAYDPMAGAVSIAGSVVAIVTVVGAVVSGSVRAFARRD
jgi:hypothetical protein